MSYAPCLWLWVFSMSTVVCNFQNVIDCLIQSNTSSDQLFHLVLYIYVSSVSFHDLEVELFVTNWSEIFITIGISIVEGI